MSDSTRDFFKVLAKCCCDVGFFGFILLFIWLGTLVLLGKSIHNLHGPMFGVTYHELNVIFYCGMGLLKLCVLVFFFIPWLAITRVLKQAEA